MDVQEAVDAPRFHHQWLPDEVGSRIARFPLTCVSRADRLGHRTTTSSEMGDVQAISIDPATGVRYGASDPRHDGVTLGY